MLGLLGLRDINLVGLIGLLLRLSESLALLCQQPLTLSYVLLQVRHVLLGTLEDLLELVSGWTFSLICHEQLQLLHMFLVAVQCRLALVDVGLDFGDGQRLLVPVLGDFGRGLWVL